MGEWEQVTAPTVNADGLERRECKNCDHFEEKAIEKIPAVWTITVNDGMGGTLTVGVGADGAYSLTEPTKIGYSFTGWVDADGKEFSASGTVNSNVTVTATWEIDATETLDELIERAAAGVDYIYLTKDIVIDRTVYFTGQTVIYSDSAVKLIRATDFAGDMIVVGQDENGKHYVLKNGVAELILGKSDGSSDITIDGNRDNVTVSVNGSAICLVNSSILEMYDGASIVNNKKVGNERAHLYADKFGNTYTVGGAAVLITSGSFDMYGGLIANNSVNLEDIGNEADGTTLLSAYGGAIYNFGTFNMYGGTIKDNEANRGGAIFTKRTVRIYAGVIEGNRATNKGGAIATSESPLAEVFLGSRGAADDTVIFRNNVADVHGGAYLGYYRTPLMAMGGVTFEGNRAEGTVGGAISTAGPVIIENTRFIDNYAYQSGGAIYQNYIGEGTTTNEVYLTDCYFEGNEAGRGGVILLSAVEDEPKAATKVYITGCTFKDNKAVERVEEKLNESTGEVVVKKSYGHGGVIYATKKTNIVINDSIFESNSASVSAGAMYLTTNTVVTVKNTHFESNSSAVYGGAIYAVASNKLTLDTVTFKNNGGISEGAYLTERGGALYVGEATVTTKSCTFEGNTASIGGALYVSGTGSYSDGDTKNISGAASTFKSNTSDKGGAACVYGSAKFCGSRFKENASGQNGGAAYAGTDARLSFVGCLFEGNRATLGSSGVKSFGGAVYAVSATLDIEDSTFQNNGFLTPEGVSGGKTYGGAVGASGAATVSVKNSKLENNTAQYGGAIAVYSLEGNSFTASGVTVTGNSSTNCGGAMYINEATATITGLVATGNESRSGGALYISECEELSIGGNSLFEANIATANGGAIFVGEQATLGDSSSAFKGNTATKGGAIYVNSSTATDATTGESVTYRGKITLENSKFTENSANLNETDSRGGAIFVAGGVVEANGASFEGNLATLYGGAICAESSSEMTLTDTVFDGNLSGGNGGALWTYFDSSTVICGIVAKGNRSQEGSGGFIYTRGDLEIKTDGERENIFGGSAEGEGNSAVSGGVIYVNGPEEDGKTSKMNISSASFIGNEASESGGAFYFIRSDADIERSSFEGNSSVKYAGAIELLNSSASIKASSFINNTAQTSGGAVYATQTPAEREIVTLGCTFTGNSSDGAGGAIYLTGTAIYRDGDEMVPLASTFENNVSANGGAICAYGAVTLYETDFDGNRSSGNGGAITSAGTLKLYECGFTGNGTEGAEANGGALYLSGSAAEINACEFADNAAGYRGGAIYSTQTPSESEIVTLGCTFSGNSATDAGGAIYLTGTATYRDGDAKVTLASTFENNNSATGGAICAYGAATLYGTYFDGNKATGNGGAITSAGTLDLNECGFTGNSTEGAEANGGALYLSGSVAEINACEFTDNAANYRGGAIYITATPKNVTIDINNSTFEGNESVNNGGAIYIIENGANSEIVTTLCTFDGNKATGNGGAIYLAGTGIYRDGNEDGTGASAFNSNSADGNGGAIGSYGKVTLYGTSFDGNSAVGGGAAYATGATTLCDVTFTNNTATGNGGALIVADEITLDGCEFTGNLATKSGSSNGGALYLSGAFGEISDCIFDSNTTGYRGGAIYVTQTAENEVVSITRSTFTGNASNTDGGAIYLTSTATVSDNGSTYTGNTATANGGAIYVDGNIALNGSTFDGNSAVGGGAVYAASATTINDAIFENNTATGNGGAIIAAKEINLYGCEFTGNKATKTGSSNGGALYISGAFGEISDCTFEGNSAAHRGGAIYITQTKSGKAVVTTGCEFDGNTSTNHGGALYLTGTATYRDGTATGNDASTFKGNSSTTDGGALYVYGSAELNGTKLEGNRAANGGSIAINVTTVSGGYSAGKVTLNGATLTSNTATANEDENGGGAIYIYAGGTLEDNFSTFTSNEALKGSAIYAAAEDGSLKATVTLVGTTASKNVATKYGAVCIYNGAEFSADNCSFTENNNTTSNGGAIFIYGADAEIKNSAFTGNTAAGSGAAIYLTATPTGAEVVTIDCTFTGNKATTNGGAVYITGTGIYRDGDKDADNGSTFDANEAVSGGAVCAYGVAELYGSTLTDNTATGNGGAIVAAKELTLYSCQLIGNKATKAGSSNGGAIYISGAVVEIIDCELTNNIAAYRGGAIYATQASGAKAVTVTGSTFTGNKATENGGAICLSGSAELSDNGSIFNSNTAVSGGAIYLYGSAELDGTTFEGNSAETGGAIAVNVTTVSGGYSAGKVTLNGAAFTNNSVSTSNAEIEANGGAIYIYAGGTLEDNGSTFTSNEAFKGGAIYAAAEDGSLKATVTLVGTTASKNVATKYGAVCIYNGAEFSADNCSFTENNNTTSNGGAIFIYGADAEIKNSAFTGNTAAGSGAAIYLTATPTGAEVVTIDCTFTGNKATTNGGAVYITGTGIYRDGDKDADNGSTFDANEAASGGAVCAYGAAELYGSSLKNNTTTGHGGAVTAAGTLVVDSSEFIGNKTTGSSSNGGAIYVSNSYATVSNTTFDGNKAGYRGGAIYATSTPEGKAVLTDNCTFKNNSAANNGGAVYLTGTAIVSDNGSTFTGNQAASGGAIMNYGKLTLVGTTITGNASGVNVAGGTLGVSGDVVVKDNTSYDVNLAKNMVITVTGELTEGALIGFTTTTADAGFAVADGVNVTDISGYADYFVSSDGVPVYADENGNLVRGYVIFSEPSRFNGFVYSVSGKPTFTWYEYVDGQKGAVVAGQTTNTLSGVEALKTYVCVVTYADGTTFESVPVTYAERQDHLECGGAVCDCTAGHTESIVWIPITSIDELQESVKLGGYYYLACDLELTSALTLEADVAICLNGKILSRADGAGNLIKVEGYELTLTDCSETERVGHIDPATSLWTEGAYTGDGTALAVTLKGGIVMGGNASYGGAIYVKTGSLTAYGINIINNISSTEGGAIYAHTSNVTLVGVSLVANGSGKGGAIYTTDPDSTGKLLTTKNCSFTSNAASGNGGAIYLTGTAVYSDNGSTFKNNSAASGGAICAYGVAELSGATFKNNTSTGHGGAIVAAKELNLSSCEFEGNTATTSGTANGGALYISGAFAEIEGCSFKNNSTGYRGGAIYVTSTPTDTEVVTKSCTFDGNSVSSNIGGAIYLTGSAIYRDGDAGSNNGSTFKNNSAANGGAIGSYGTATLNGTIFESNVATARGGAIYVAGKTVTVNGATFESNVATTSGGAIYATASTLNVNDSTFEGNSATTSGGAICAETNAILNVVGGTYTGNKVTSTATGTYTNMGGAIAIGASTTASISGNAIFTSNSGCASGGAVAVYGSGATLTVNGATFDGNSAANGGAIYAGGASVTTVKAMTAKGNKATSLGAVVYVTSASTKLTLEGAVIYDNNTAKDISCGFIHLANASGVVDIYKGNVKMLSSADDTEVTITDWTDLLLNPKSGTINELS